MYIVWALTAFICWAESVVDCLILGLAEFVDFLHRKTRRSKREVNKTSYLGFGLK